MYVQVLTATIIIGWTLHVLILGSWTSLGYTQGIVGGEPASSSSSLSSFISNEFFS